MTKPEFITTVVLVFVDIMITIFIIEVIVRKQDERRNKVARESALLMLSISGVEFLRFFSSIYDMERKMVSFAVGGYSRRSLLMPPARLTQLGGLSLLYSDNSAAELERLCEHHYAATANAASLADPHLFRSAVSVGVEARELLNYLSVGGWNDDEPAEVQEQFEKERNRVCERTASEVASMLTLLSEAGATLEVTG